jgi:hypothetical protein
VLEADSQALIAAREEAVDIAENLRRVLDTRIPDGVPGDWKRLKASIRELQSALGPDQRITECVEYLRSSMADARNYPELSDAAERAAQQLASESLAQVDEIGALRRDAAAQLKTARDRLATLEQTTRDMVERRRDRDVDAKPSRSRPIHDWLVDSGPG